MVKVWATECFKIVNMSDTYEFEKPITGEMTKIEKNSSSSQIVSNSGIIIWSGKKVWSKNSIVNQFSFMF